LLQFDKLKLRAIHKLNKACHQLKQLLGHRHQKHPAEVAALAQYRILKRAVQQTSEARNEPYRA
jgi:hypothetical protein